MKNAVFLLAWAFVLCVAGYDVYFAWHYRANFTLWEMNPFARWLAWHFGLMAVFTFKITMLGFAVAVGAYCHRRNHHLELPYTLIISGVHLYLWLYYVLSDAVII